MKTKKLKRAGQKLVKKAKKKLPPKKAGTVKKLVKRVIKHVKALTSPSVALTCEKGGYAVLGAERPTDRVSGDSELLQIKNGSDVIAEAYVQKRGWLWIEVRKITVKEGVKLPAKAKALAKLFSESKAYAREHGRLMVVGTAAKENWLASAFAKNKFKLAQLVKNPKTGNLVSVYLTKATA